MAYAINANTYANFSLNDTLTGSPDYWTNVNSATHSYSSNELTFVDNSTGASRAITNTPGSSSVKTWYLRTTWKYTANNGSTPIGITIGNISFGVAIGFYIDFGASGLIYARNGNGWTSTGQTVANNTYKQIEFTADRNAGTWKLYIDGSLINTYNIDLNTDADWAMIVIGGGTTAATETYVFSDVFMVKNTVTMLSTSGFFRAAM